MSEFGDFEKIEFQKSCLIEPISDQETDNQTDSSQTNSNLTDSNQHSNDESLVTKMTFSTKQKTAQLEELEFELAWKTREEIIGNLNQHTKLLSGLLITADARKEMRKANNDLMAILMNLPAKVDGQLKSFEPLENRPDGGLNEVVLDLSLDMKSRIVDTLLANHHVVLLEADSVSSESKTKLINENNDLIYELLKLRTRTVAISGGSPKEDLIRLIHQATNKKLGQLNTKSSPNVDQVAIMKELEELNGSMISHLAELEGNLKKLNVRMAEADARRSESTFTWKLKGVKALLAVDGWKDSNFFYCGGIRWYLSVRTSVEAGVKYFGVYLFHKDDTIDSWSVEATFELRLLNTTWRSVDRAFTEKDHTFKKPYHFTGFGWKQYITVDKLLSGSFIQDDTIHIRVELTTKNFKKIAD